MNLFVKGKRMAPEFSRMADETYDTKVNFMSIDIDKAEAVPELNILLEGITSVPTFHFYKDGKLADELHGANVAKLKVIIANLSKKEEEAPTAAKEEPSVVPEVVPELAKEVATEVVPEAAPEVAPVVQEASAEAVSSEPVDMEKNVPEVLPVAQEPASEPPKSSEPAEVIIDAAIVKHTD